MRPFAFVVALIVATPAAGETIALTNGSFESGFDGWTVTMDQGVSNFRGDIKLMDAGVMNIDDGSLFGYLPVDGQELLTMRTQEGGFFTGGFVDYFFGVSQTITLDAGWDLSGWAAFIDGDMAPQDTAFVRIYDSTGALIATPWFARSGLDGPNPLDSWHQWNWTATSAGTYTLSLGMGTTGDNNLRSRAFFDDVRVGTPEPSSLGILLIGVGLYQIKQRRKRAAARAKLIRPAIERPVSASRVTK